MAEGTASQEKKMEEAIGALKGNEERKNLKDLGAIKNNLVSLSFPEASVAGSQDIKKMEEAIGALKEGHGSTAKEKEEIKNNLVSLSFPEASAAGSRDIKKMEEAIGALKEGHGSTAIEEEIKNNLVSLSFPEASAAGSQDIKKMEEAIGALKEGHGSTAIEEEIKNNLVSLSFPEASAAGSQDIKKMEEIKNNLVSLSSEHRYILEENDAEGNEAAAAPVTPTDSEGDEAAPAPVTSPPLAFPVSTDYHMVVLACIAAMVALIPLRAELYESHYYTMLITVAALGAYGLGATFMLKLQQLGFKPGILSALISRLILSVGVITIACLGSMLLPDNDIVWCFYVAVAFVVCSMMVTWDILCVMYDPL